MSSAPSGLSVQEYGYFVFRYTIPDGAEHLLQASQRWMVTRFSYFAPETFPPPGNGYVILDGSSQIFVQPGGCVELEPNGAFRGNILVFGEGAIVLVESWFQPDASGNSPTVQVT